MTFAIATPPTPSLGSRVPLKPTFTQKAAGKCRYRPWVTTIAADFLFIANAWDQPFYFNGSAFADMGSAEPTTGAAVTIGSSGWIADGVTVLYYIVWRNSALGKETAPHPVTLTNSSGGTRNGAFTWVDPVIAEFDKARIYRALAATGLYVKVADVTISAGVYTDTSNDAAITLNFAYVRRWRTTKPPVFAGLVANGNRLWGWTGKDALLYYGQLYRTDGEFALDDFPSAGATTDGGVLPVAPNDGFGPITSCVTFFEALYVFKAGACYRVTGRTVATFAVELVFSDRGCIAHRSAIVVEDSLYFLDRRGIYRMDSGGALYQAAAIEATKESPLAPTWARLNLDAARYINAAVDEIGGYYYLAVALDDDPVPLYVVPLDFRRNRYVSRDTTVCAMALGRLQDASGLQHLIRLDDLGDVMEDAIGNSDVASADTLTGTITASTALGVLTASAATFTTTSGGNVGASFERYSAAGAVLDQNRIAANTGTTVTLLYYGSAAVTTSSDMFGVGAIPALFRSGLLDFGEPRLKKTVHSMVVQYVTAALSSIKVQGAPDSASDTLLKEFALSAVQEKQLVSVRQWGFAWAFQFSNRNAGEGWSISAVDIELSTGNDRD